MDTLLIILSSILVISFFSSEVNSDECYRCPSGYHCCVSNTQCCKVRGFTVWRIIGLVIAGIVGLSFIGFGIYLILIRCTKNKRIVTSIPASDVAESTTEQEISSDQALDIPANEPPRYEQMTNEQQAQEHTQNQLETSPELQQHNNLQSYSGDVGPNYFANSPSPLPPITSARKT